MCYNTHNKKILEGLVFEKIQPYDRLCLNVNITSEVKGQDHSATELEPLYLKNCWL